MKAIILAGGVGKRMKSDLPKVLNIIGGKPMLHYVIEACLEAEIKDITVVIGQGGELVKKSVPYPVNYAWQEQQLGTGHAALCGAKDHVGPDDRVVILHGDVPLISAETIRNLMKFQQERQVHAVVVSTTVPDPTGYGRIITTPTGELEAIIEQRDLSPELMDINVINPAVYSFMGKELLYGLAQLNNNNSQQEYYLTDVPQIIAKAGSKVAVYHEPDFLQFLGINSQKQLAEASAVLRNRIADRHFECGVTIIDPSNCYIDSDVEIGQEVILHPGVVLRGKSKIGKGTEIKPYSVVESAQIGEDCEIGPFAYIRPDTVIGDRCRIGDFVEVKNSCLGDNTKASHLAYIGDAAVGSGVNFGCGAITVNYDGENKHKTVIESGAFIGSNVNLVAPVAVRSGAFVAAGSTIVDEVPAEAFSIARQRQTTKADGAKKYKRNGEKL